MIGSETAASYRSRWVRVSLKAAGRDCRPTSCLYVVVVAVARAFYVHACMYTLCMRELGQASVWIGVDVRVCGRVGVWVFVRWCMHREVMDGDVSSLLGFQLC